MALSTIGSIANFIAESFDNLPEGISGNLIEISDMARQHVANFIGQDIGSNSINAPYQPAILDFAKADTVDMATAQGTNDDVKLSELTINGKAAMSAAAFRMMGENKLKLLGQRRRFARSLS